MPKPGPGKHKGAKSPHWYSLWSLPIAYSFLSDLLRILKPPWFVPSLVPWLTRFSCSLIHSFSWQAARSNSKFKRLHFLKKWHFPTEPASIGWLITPALLIDEHRVMSSGFVFCGAGLSVTHLRISYLRGSSWDYRECSRENIWSSHKRYPVASNASLRIW